MTDKQQVRELVHLGSKVPVRIIYPKLFVPTKKKINGRETGALRFWADFIIPKNSDDAKLLIAAVNKVQDAAFPTRDPEVKYHRPTSDGDKLNEKAKEKGKRTHEWRAGQIVLKTSMNAFDKENQPKFPELFDKRKGPIPVTDKNLFYSGCRVEAILQIASYDNESKGVGAYISGIMFVKDDTRIGGVDVASTFKYVVGQTTTEDPTGGAPWEGGDDDDSSI